MHSARTSTTAMHQCRWSHFATVSRVLSQLLFPRHTKYPSYSHCNMSTVSDRIPPTCLDAYASFGNDSDDEWDESDSSTEPDATSRPLRSPCQSTITEQGHNAPTRLSSSGLTNTGSRVPSPFRPPGIDEAVPFGSWTAEPPSKSVNPAFLSNMPEYYSPDQEVCWELDRHRHHAPTTNGAALLSTYWDDPDTNSNALCEY